MKTLICFLISALIMLSTLNEMHGQNATTYSKEDRQISKLKTHDPLETSPSINIEIKNLEAPIPGGSSYRSFLLRQKTESRKRFPLRLSEEKTKEKSMSIESPLIVEEFPLREYFFLLDDKGDTLFLTNPNGDTILKPEVRLIGGGTPLDNTLAISNENFLMCAINSKIYMHDLKTGIDPKKADINIVSFEGFADDEGGINTNAPFDPKIIYDPLEDRFVLTFLSGRTPNDSKLILAFSSSNKPTDPWHVYEIPGNPYENGLWSDYPAISVSENEIFYTINLLVPGSDWKVSFDQTVIWQIDKFSGYNGENILKSALWGDIEHDGRNLRNLAVVHGSMGIEGPNMFFLSNRNFDISNDTTFLVEITNKIDASAVLKITPLIAEVPYGLPPNGRQENSDPNDPDDGFDTNDARVLGAYKHKNEIQFVGNSIDPNTGLAAVYHGLITDLDKVPGLEARIIGNGILDFGYPNIVYTGSEGCENSSFIAFDHTSPNNYSGVSGLKFIRNETFGDYSELMTLKEGEDYVEQIPGSYERWGDYFGLQRKYDEPGLVYSAGFFGTGEDNRSGTWFNVLRDCECFESSMNEVVTSAYNKCIGQVIATTRNGIDPLSYTWNGESRSANYLDVNLCNYSYEVEISDVHGCKLTYSDSINLSTNAKNRTIFPNPTQGDLNVYFELKNEARVSVYIYNIEGKIVYQLVDNVLVKNGKNQLTFSLDALETGSYILKIMDGDDEIMTEKFIVN